MPILMKIAFDVGVVINKYGLSSGWRLMVERVKCFLSAFVLFAVSTTMAVETADFVRGIGTNGWSVADGAYVSPNYLSGVSRIEIECANSAPDCTVAVFATSATGKESQIASFAVVSTSATFIFAASTDFRSFRIETGGQIELAIVSITMFPALFAVPISSLDGDVYVQDFNSLATITATAGAKDWLNGVTLPCWQAWRGGDAVTSFNYNGGKVKTGGLYALAAEQKSGLRALGGYSTRDLDVSWGIAFTNDTDALMRLACVAYSAQQWGFSNTSEHILSFSCMVTNRIGWSENVLGGWLDCCDTIARVVGSDESYPVPVVSHEVYSPEVPPRIHPGDVVSLRWTIRHAASGYSAMMAIDDLDVTFIREDRPFVIHVVKGGMLHDLRQGWWNDTIPSHLKDATR